MTRMAWGREDLRILAPRVADDGLAPALAGDDVDATRGPEGHVGITPDGDQADVPQLRQACADLGGRGRANSEHQFPRQCPRRLLQSPDAGKV